MVNLVFTHRFSDKCASWHGRAHIKYTSLYRENVTIFDVTFEKNLWITSSLLYDDILEPVR